MKVCVVMGGHFSLQKGGAQYQAMLLTQELAKQSGLDVTYVTRDVQDQQIDGYRLVGIGERSRFRRFGMFTDAPRLYRAISHVNPDVIYQQALQSDTGVCGYFAKRAGKRFVFHIASDFDVHTRSQLQAREIVGGPGLVDKKIGEYGLRKAQAVVAQTDYQAESLLENYGIEPAATVRNFLPVPEEAQAKPEAVKIAWVANFKRVKRPELFVQLAESLKHLNVSFVMAGRGGDSAPYEALHERMQSLPNLQYLGELEVSEVEDLLATSHLLVNTSMVEGFPNTFIQAWLREMPVATLGVNTDGLLDSGSDFGFCANSYEELVSKVEHLVTHRAELTALGEKARRLASQKFSMKNVDALVNVVLG